MRINESDLAVINRAIGHDLAPRTRAFFRDEEDRLRTYMKRHPTIAKKEETTREYQRTARKMLEQLPTEEQKKLKTANHLETVLKIIAKYSSYEELKNYPNILRAL